MIASATWRLLAWRTVVSEQKLLAQKWPFGYSLKRPWLSNDFALNFSGYRFSVQLESPGTSLIGIQEKQWLCGDRLLYLVMNLRNDYGSYSMDETAKVIFDFERGDLYTFNSPWRVGSTENGKKRDMTESQFSDVLTELTGGCRSN